MCFSDAIQSSGNIPRDEENPKSPHVDDPDWQASAIGQPLDSDETNSVNRENARKRSSESKRALNNKLRMEGKTVYLKDNFILFAPD